MKIIGGIGFCGNVSAVTGSLVLWYHFTVKSIPLNFGFSGLDKERYEPMF